MTRNKSNITLNQAKIAIFGKKSKKVNIQESKENTKKVQSINTTSGTRW